MQKYLEILKKSPLFSNISEEEYIATSKALENERLTMEMHDKQLKHLMKACKGFKDEAERQNFISMLRKEYANGEKELKEECDKHMEALNELMKAYQARTGLITEIVTKTDIKNEVSFASSNERMFIVTMLTRYNNMKHASNVSAGFSSK